MTHKTVRPPLSTRKDDLRGRVQLMRRDETKNQRINRTPHQFLNYAALRLCDGIVVRWNRLRHFLTGKARVFKFSAALFGDLLTSTPTLVSPVGSQTKCLAILVAPVGREPALPQFVGDPDRAERWLLDEWRQMWQQCLKTTDLRIVDVRVTENAGEVAK